MRIIKIDYKTITITVAEPNITVCSSNGSHFTSLGNYGNLKDAFRTILCETVQNARIKEEVKELSDISERVQWDINKTKIEAMRANLAHEELSLGR